MSKIIGVTVGTNINPAKFNSPTDEQVKKAVDDYFGENPPDVVTDYNDLTNKPVVYVENVDLDDALDVLHVPYGRSIISNYTFEGQVYEQPAFLYKTSFGGGHIKQRIWTPYMYCERNYDVQSYVWNDKARVIYQPQNIGIERITAPGGKCKPEANKKYFLNLGSDCSFELPVVAKTNPHYGGWNYIDTQILIYANVTDDVSIDWGTDVLFYNNEIPEIGIGYYEFIFTYDRNAEKWCVGVLSKGAVE